MKQRLKPLALVACMLATSCQTPLRPISAHDQSIDFSSYQTFSWIDPHPLIRAATQRPLSPLVEQRLMNETKTALTRQGFLFVEDPEQADLVVAFTVGSREGIRITSSMSDFRRGRGPRPWGGYWGTRTVRKRPYTEGQLAIDLFDVAQARPVWHGTVSRRITQQDREEPDDAIREVVEAILELFPPS